MRLSGRSGRDVKNIRCNCGKMKYWNGEAKSIPTIKMLICKNGAYDEYHKPTTSFKKRTLSASTDCHAPVVKSEVMT